MKKTILYLLIFSITFLISCNRNNYKSGKNVSQATGWKINSADGGFKLNSKYKGQINAPGMIFIQGGTFVKGNTKDNVMHDWNNTPTQQYVRSFFIDETEVTNAMYIEYLFWLKNMYGDDEQLQDIYNAALPDTLVWRNPLGFNEDMVNNYLRHPAFQNHPVVGVSWKQATNYAKWRTQRVNVRILAEKGFLQRDSVLNPDSKLNFNTSRYLLDPENSLGDNIDELIGEFHCITTSIMQSSNIHIIGSFLMGILLQTWKESLRVRLAVAYWKDFLNIFLIINYLDSSLFLCCSNLFFHFSSVGVFDFFLNLFVNHSDFTP